MEHKYHLIYTSEAFKEGLTQEEVRQRSNAAPRNITFGATDAVLLCSILYPEEGVMGVLFAGHDGRTNEEIGPDETWKVWTILAKRLADDLALNDEKREICKIIHEAVTNKYGVAMVSAKVNNEPHEGPAVDAPKVQSN